MFRIGLAIKKGKGNVTRGRVVDDLNSGVCIMRFVALAVGFLVIPFIATGQTKNFESEGNLARTHDVMCIAVQDAKVQYTPADLAMAIVRCGKKKEFDKAVELLVLMQLRAAYDAKRVEDKSAHQAGAVLAMQIRAELGQSRMEKIMAAFGRIGGDGSPRHKAICAEVKRAGPPDYHPAYMIQHGMSAFIGRKGNGLVKGFQSKKVWRDLLANYLKCS